MINKIITDDTTNIGELQTETCPPMFSYCVSDKNVEQSISQFDGCSIEPITSNNSTEPSSDTWLHCQKDHHKSFPPH